MDTEGVFHAHRAATLIGLRTLLISDLHLGSRGEHDVLRRPVAMEALGAAIERCERLVLLGDVVEMIEGRPRTAMGIARPVIEEIGRRAGRDREVVVVPGNHDQGFVRPWLKRRREQRRPLGLATRVPVSSSPMLTELAQWLKPARVQVRYPGLWVGDRVFATHGHYLDRHLVPVSSTGLPRWLVGTEPGRHATAWNYELAAGTSSAAIQGLLATSLPSVVGEPIDRAVGLARSVSIAAIPLAAHLVGEGNIAPLSAGALGFQFRRAGLPAITKVAQRLNIRADHVIFGHLHRLGPRGDDDPQDWAPDDGRRTFTNTGSWTYEPLLLAGSRPPHAYWPGGAVWVEGDGSPPRAVGLLDEIDEQALR